LSTASPKALIVDFGGVLTTSVLHSFQLFCQQSGVSPEALKRALIAEMDEQGVPDAGHPLWALETGRLSGEEFNRYLSEVLSAGLDAPLDPEGLKDRMFAEVRADARMFHAVKRVRDLGFKTALLSNSWGPDGYPRDVFGEMFDQVIISGEVGLRKPEAEIYLLAAERLALPPEACVFVDDLRTNVRGAEAVGMVGLHHIDTDATLRSLEGSFGPLG